MKHIAAKLAAEHLKANILSIGPYLSRCAITYAAEQPVLLSKWLAAISLRKIARVTLDEHNTVDFIII